MMLATTFDLWKKDTFFHAAEEVQESADRMESAYRAWIRERKERSSPEDLDELSRELQTSLGTAKWQLEEFEKAIRLSHRHHGDDTTITRHQHFISAIESQISRVEVALRESYDEEGRQPLRWINLDKEERDDLALFLSGAPQTVPIPHSDFLQPIPLMQGSHLGSQVNKTCSNHGSNSASNRDISNDIKASKDSINTNEDANYIIEIKADEISGTRDDMACPVDRITNSRRVFSSLNVVGLRIAISDEDEPRNRLTDNVQATPKEKGSKPFFWKQRYGDYTQAMGVLNKFNQLFGQVGRFQSPQQLQHNCSVQVTLILMLTIFLIVPFVLYST